MATEQDTGYGPQQPFPPFAWTKRIGTVEVDGYKHPLGVTIEVDWNGERLSLVGHIGDGRNPYSSGQIRRTLREFPELIEATEGLADLLDLWDAWHLNDMQAGCAHQTADGWNKRPIDPTKPLDSYGHHVGPDKSPTWNMLVWVRPTEHPQGLLGVPCLTCGYRYGRSWLSKPVPTDVLARVKAFGD